MQSQGVIIVHAEPKWAKRLLEGLKKADNLAHSHLYADPQMQIGTWQRIDIPILPELSQWEYVLFTDADVYFRKPITLDSFGLPLPSTFGMASEMSDMFPYNAGVMLMHLPPLQATYAGFVEFIFNNQNGMFFPGEMQSLADLWWGNPEECGHPGSQLPVVPQLGRWAAHERSACCRVWARRPGSHQPIL